MLRADQVDGWIGSHGPWLYWRNPRLDVWPWVLRDGVLPRTETGQKGQVPAMESRPGHIYFMTDHTPRARAAGFVGGEPHLRIDIRKLDISRFATDEDRIRAHKKPKGGDFEETQLPGWRDLPERTDALVGDWMNTYSKILDQSEWVMYSMERLTVAYAGSVPFESFEVLPPYLLTDWEPADPGEEYVATPKGAVPRHYLGDPAYFLR